MPYVTCSRCALTAYTAARWTTTDDCPGCGAPLKGAERFQAPSGRAACPPIGLSQAFQNPPTPDQTSRVSAG